MVESFKVVFVSHPDLKDTSYRPALSTDFLYRLTAKGRLEDETAYYATVFDNFSYSYDTTDGRQINFNLWDTAGQQEYNTLRAASYSFSSVVVFLFQVDHPNDLQCMIDTYIPEMRTHCPKANILLVGCFPENRDVLLHQENADITSILDNEVSSKPVVMPSEGIAAVEKIRQSRPAGIRTKYVEYSPRTFAGFQNVIDSVVELTQVRNTRKSVIKGPTNYNLFQALWNMIMLPRFSLHDRVQPSVPSTKAIIQQNIKLLNQNTSIASWLDRLGYVIDTNLFLTQEKILQDNKVIGVSATAFTLLRLLHNIHSNETSTRSVVADVIVKATEGAKCSYFYYLLGRRDSCGQPFVGEVSIFLSHAWDYRFSLVEDLARDFSTVYYFQHNQFPYYWCDLFIKNQHLEAPVDNS